MRLNGSSPEASRRKSGGSRSSSRALLLGNETSTCSVANSRKVQVKTGEAGEDGARRTSTDEEGRLLAFGVGPLVGGSAVKDSRRCAWLAVVALLLCAWMAGCHRGHAAPSPDLAEPTVVVRQESEALLLTWIDDKGDFHVEPRVAHGPMMGRDAVRVVDPSRDDSAHPDSVFVVDLRQIRPDGTYPVRNMARADFEAMAVARREKTGPTLASARSVSESPLPGWTRRRPARRSESHGLSLSFTALNGGRCVPRGGPIPEAQGNSLRRQGHREGPGRRQARCNRSSRKAGSMRDPSSSSTSEAN